MDRVKIAVIGAGSLANSVHYPALASLADAEVAALCDLDAGKAQRTAQRFGIARTFTDYREMLDQIRPDAVYAIMPPHVLFDVATDVLERGHHLFVEKPPAVTTLQTESLARLASRRRLITAVGFQRRYHPMLQACWQEVQRKGQVHQVVSCFYKNLPPQDVHPYYRGAIDILRSDAIHTLDALRYYCGLSDVEAVSSEVRNLDCWYPVSYNTLVCFANGAVGVMLGNWRTGKRTLRFEFHSIGASAFADADGEGKVFSDNKEAPDLSTTCTEFVNSSEPHIVQGFQAESQAFVEAVRTGQPLHNSIEDSVETMRLCDLVYEKAINRKAGA